MNGDQENRRHERSFSAPRGRTAQRQEREENNVSRLFHVGKKRMSEKDKEYLRISNEQMQNIG